MRKSNNWPLLLFTVLLIIGAGFAINFINYIYSPILQPASQSVEFTFAKNSSLKTLVNGLTKGGVLKRPRYFVLLAYLTRATKKLQAGRYRIIPGVTPSQFLAMLVSGKVILHPFTIIPGTTFATIVAKLEEDQYLFHTLKGLNDDQIMAKIGRSGELPEGRFFPDTYMFGTGTKDVTILKNAFAEMQHKLAQAWQARNPNLPYSCPYKALIVASVIEKEASDSHERRVIAEIIVNRLKKNMFLQLDPTISYGLNKQPNDKLTSQDLKSDTPFNTYRYKGLPPTPICMPSLEAFEAVLHPLATNYLYFVAKGDGTHAFSITLAEHNRAVAKYQQ